MARQNHGPLSRAKGKLGGVVYQQYEGMQISREYQPVVKNPQTTKQVENRAKFKLSSQIVAQFASVFNVRLAKLSIYARSRRAACVNAIYSAINTTNPNSPSALFESVTNAINQKSLAANNDVYFDTSNNQLSIIAPNGYVVTYTNALYDKTDGKFLTATTESYTSTGSAKVIQVSERARNVIMVTGYHAITEAGRATISNIGTSASAFTISIARAIANGDIEISEMMSYTYATA